MRIRNVLKSFIPDVGKSNETSREHWLKEVLLSIPQHSRILDAGAGTQRYRRFCEHLNYISQDFGEYDGQGDSAGLQPGGFDYGKLDIVSNITSIPEPESSFDAIMCVKVLEHLPEPIEAIREFARLLKPKGHLIITAPFCSLTHFAPYHFSTGFNKYWYYEHLTKNGFTISDMSLNGNFFEYIGQEVYRIPSVASRYSQSRPSRLELIAMYVVQRMLLRLSKNDTGSSELLCYGYHVYAQKD